MNIKRILCILIAVVMVSFSVACGGEAVGGGNSGGGSNAGNTGGSETGREDGSASGGSGGSNAGNAGGGSSSGGGGDTGNTGGGGGAAGGGSLTGSPIEILGGLVDDISSAGVDMPISLPPTEVALDLSHNTIGLTEAEFERLVVSAAFNVAAIGTFAHQIIVIQANDARAAGEVKGLVSAPGGYDPQKWICVWPERAIVVESGEYVLLAASRAEVVEAAIDAFRDEAGTIGTVVTFFEHEGGDDGGGGGFAGPGGAPITIG